MFDRLIRPTNIKYYKTSNAETPLEEEAAVAEPPAAIVAPLERAPPLAVERCQTLLRQDQRRCNCAQRARLDSFAPLAKL